MAMITNYAPICFHAEILRPLKDGPPAGYPFWTFAILFSFSFKKPQKLGRPTRQLARNASSIFEANRRAEVGIPA